jgi:hypothetical protein
VATVYEEMELTGDYSKGRKKMDKSERQLITALHSLGRSISKNLTPLYDSGQFM